MTILVTGGLGYIGSHTTIELLETGYDVIIIDNLTNSSKKVIDRIEKITGKKCTTYFIDLRDWTPLNTIFQNHQIESVIHFASYKAVAESVEHPLKYYSNNILSTLNLCHVMEKNDVYNIIFSSSAAVYGNAKELPITEDAPTNALHPYGRTKLMCEEILTDVANSNEKWNVVLLRYFNPVAAHHSGMIGESPHGMPNNLMPYITRVASRKVDHLNIYGIDYPTKDGTGVRDYIHITDLARGHIAALNYVKDVENIETFNLGTGEPYSVLEVVNTFEKVTGLTIPYKIVERRSGDVAASYADPTKANQLLSWHAEKQLVEMCTDAWRWESEIQMMKS